MRPPRFSINESLWVCGGARTQEILYPRVEVAALRERGARVFLLNGAKDAGGLEELGRLARQNDRHIVLMWLRPREMMALHPILRERKNFSVVLDDWWIYPRWLTRDADYIINRMYNGVAVRLGHARLVTSPPPLISLPQTISPYGVASLLLRVPALAAWPAKPPARQSIPAVALQARLLESQTHLLQHDGGSGPFPMGCSFEDGVVTRFLST